MTDDFVARVHSLPTELFDQIYDYVFTPDPDASVTLSRDYKPPVQLHISRATRATYAQAYYGSTAFNFPRSTYVPSALSPSDDDHEIFTRFLLSLPPSHRFAIRTLHFPREIQFPCTVQSLRPRRQLLNTVREDIAYALLRCGAFVRWDDALAPGTVVMVGVMGEGVHGRTLRTVVRFVAPLGPIPLFL